MNLSFNLNFKTMFKGFLALLFLVPSVYATVTIEVTIGELENLPAGAVGILVADRDNNGFTSPADPTAANTPLVAGQRFRNSDDVIIASIVSDDSNLWSGGAGFADTIAGIDYDRLDIEVGDPLIFYWFPTLSSQAAVLGAGLEYLSFRSDTIGVSGGTIAFLAPENGGTYRLSYLSTSVGGDVDPSDLGASGTAAQGQTPDRSTPEVNRDLLTPGDFSQAPSETNANYDSLQAGSYIGLVRRDAVGADEADIAGIVSGKVTHNKKTGVGTTSLSLLYERIKYGIKGGIAASGEISASFTKKDPAKTPMTMTGQLIDTPEGRKIVGTITGDGKTTRIDIFQRVFHSKRNPAPQAGKYTLALPFDEAADHSAQPGGDGIGYGTLSGSGTMKTALVLGDGTKATAVFYLSADGEMVFYRSLYKKSASGWIAGKVTFREVDNISLADGLLHWQKGVYEREALYPLGFNLEQRIVAAPFTVPNSRAGRRVLSELPNDDENAILNFAGGNTLPVSGKFLNWDSRNRIKPATAIIGESLALKISAKTGVVSGRYRNKEAGQDLRFVGVAIQNQGLVVGHFKGIGQSGSVVIDSSGHPALFVERVSDGGAIADGDSLDFGAVGVDGGMTEIGFRVRNSGTGTLVLNGVPTLNQSGAGFMLSAKSSGPIRPGGERQIRVLFDPAIEGNETGSVVIHSNDESQNPFMINLSGLGIAGSQGAGRENSDSDHIDTPFDYLTGIENSTSDYDSTLDPGNYSGLVHWDRAGSIPAGKIAAKISHSTKTGTGSVTGSIFANGSSLKFKGTLSTVGVYSGTLSGRGNADFTMSLSVGEALGGEQALSGRLSNLVSGDEYLFVALKSGWSKATQSPYSGSYTILLPAKARLGEGYPGGDGAGTLASSTAGTIKLLTYLADGSRLSWSGRVDDSGKIHIYRPLDRLKPSPSLISGMLTFRDIPNISDFDGELYWRRAPNGRTSTFAEGFEISQEAIGSAFSPPAKNEFVLPNLSEAFDNSELILTGNTLDESFDLDWATSNRITYIAVGAERIANKISTKSGMLSGYWWDRGNTETRVSYRGVAFQKQGVLSGYWYYLDGQTGLMQVRPK